MLIVYFRILEIVFLNMFKVHINYFFILPELSTSLSPEEIKLPNRTTISSEYDGSYIGIPDYMENCRTIYVYNKKNTYIPVDILCNQK